MTAPCTNVPPRGFVINRLTFTGETVVIEKVRLNRPGPSRLKFAQFACICGTVKFYYLYRVLIGHTKSCGCLQKEKASITGKSRQLGADHRQLRGCWNAMLSRCISQDNQAYERYGGRGITVCDSWAASFDDFKNWSIANGFMRGLTLDRENNDLGYSPDNCRWVPHVTQNRNRRDNRMIEAFGQSKCLSEWVEDGRCNTTRSIIKKRLASGETAEYAISGGRQRASYSRSCGVPPGSIERAQEVRVSMARMRTHAGRIAK